MLLLKWQCRNLFMDSFSALPELRFGHSGDKGEVIVEAEEIMQPSIAE